MSEKRGYELEDRLKKEETEKGSLLEIVKRLSLPSPPQSFEQPINSQKPQDSSPLTDEDTVKLTNKKRSLLSSLWPRKRI